MDIAELEAIIAAKRREQGIVEPAAPPVIVPRVAEPVAPDPPPVPADLPPARTVASGRRRPVPTVPFNVPAPDLRFVDAIHRGSDGFVPFGSKASDGTWRELGCVRASAINGLFKAEWLADALDTNGYFGINAMFGTASRRRRTTLPELLPSLRKADHVRWLTTAYVDLDVYNVGMSAEDGVSAILKLANAGTVPPPTMFSISAGCWAFWMLRDDAGSGPVRAWPEAVDRWCTIQRELHRRCADLGADAAVNHAATLSRIPGSVHTKTRRRVAWLACFDDERKPFKYTMRELESALGVMSAPVRIVDHRPAGPKDPSRIERGKRGYHGRWERFLTVMDQLRRCRCGWRVGCRTKALSLVAQGCRARGWSWSTPEGRRELQRHLDGMEQPPGDKIGDADLRRIMRAAPMPTRGGVRWQTVADLLDVTIDESAVLSSRRSRIPPARRHELLPPTKVVPPADRQRQRRAAVLAIVERLGYTPTTAVMRDLLESEGIDGATDKTLLRDLAAVGHPSPRAHKPREARDGQLTMPMVDGPDGPS